MTKTKLPSIEETRLAFVNTCKELGLDPDHIPKVYIDLAALTSRKMVDAFCLANDIEPPTETTEESLRRLMEAGVIDEEQAEIIRRDMQGLQ